jgi:hypothetical protein
MTYNNTVTHVLMTYINAVIHVNRRRTDNTMAKTKSQLTNNDLQNTTENKKIEQLFHSIMQTNISSRP